jgi:hypothetical protein
MPVRSNRLRIYVAGPLSADSDVERVRNVTRAIAAGVRILKMGYVPFIPHLTHYVDVWAVGQGIRISKEDYLQWDCEWLRCCDALLYLGSSPGADRELELAQRDGIAVYRSIEEIPSLAKKLGGT